MWVCVCVVYSRTVSSVELELELVLVRERRMADIWYRFSSVQQHFTLYPKMIFSFLRIVFVAASKFLFAFSFGAIKNYTFFIHVIYFPTSKNRNDDDDDMNKNVENDLFPIIYILCTIFLLSLSLLEIKENKVRRHSIAFFMCKHSMAHFVPCKWWNRCQKIEFQQYNGI